MAKVVAAAVLLLSLAACDDGMPLSCSCLRPPPIEVTGHLTLSNRPLGGISITMTAYPNQCGQGAALATATGRTDFFGGYALDVYPTDTASAACLRVAYSASVFADTNGIPVDPFALPTVVVTLNLVGP